MIEKELIERIRKEIKESGHTVSLKASIILNKKGWYVRNSTFYFDKNIKNFRELDIVAQKKSSLIKDAIETLIIECKKSKDKPWIFFRQNKFNNDVFSLNVDMAETTEGSVYDLLEKNIFKKHYYYNRPIYTYYFTPFTKPNSKEAKQIFEAIEQVTRALSFYYTQRSNLFYNYRLKPEIPTFFYPIIVFDGKIFEAVVVNDDIEVKETNWVSLWIEFEIEEPLLMKILYKQGFSKIVFSKPIVIDIVTLNYFEKFLENFEKPKSE